MARPRVPLAVVLPVLALLLPLLLATAPALAEEETLKIQVLGTYKFTNLTAYMYNSTANALQAVDTSKVQVLDYEIKDLAADDVQPAVLVSLDAPTTDLNTGESIFYAWLLSGVYGDSLVIAVADVNETDNSVTSMQYYKISPVSGDVAIIRTAYDIVVDGPGYKLSIPLANFTNPKVLLMTDSYVTLSAINHVELRALRNPPSGFVLVRSGSGEAVFTISASGDLTVWFDEEHDVGDVDLFIYDVSDPDYSAADLTHSWSWHRSHCTAYIYADSGPYTRTVRAHGSVKFVVKRFSGNAAGVQWRVACRLVAGSTPTPTQTPAQTPSPTQTQTPAPTAQAADLFARIQGALSGQSTTTILVIIAVMLFIVALAVARR